MNDISMDPDKLKKIHEDIAALQRALTKHGDSSIDGLRNAGDISKSVKGIFEDKGHKVTEHVQTLHSRITGSLNDLNSMLGELQTKLSNTHAINTDTDTTNADNTKTVTTDGGVSR
jgi:hypothetical protein